MTTDVMVIEINEEIKPGSAPKSETARFSKNSEPRESSMKLRKRPDEGKPEKRMKAKSRGAIERLWN